MNEPEDKYLWKALDAFKGVEPHPQSRARFWARVAREEAAGEPWSIYRWLARFVLPALGTACAVIALYAAGQSLVEKRTADREISANIEFYRNYEVIQNLAQTASYERPEQEGNGVETDVEVDFELIQ